ncbi:MULTISPECIES: cupin domain-containing protein [unclassified Bacillus (in: firmicutes)]|uniref:cupin domain-containing protein n=1 Tax=unclassified Bacillus (in: firmicutes) TaxID=185979 RepID=UPI001C162D14|nr:MULTISPECIES: cupin domain-containing protein [unclassified Bacillus (in: firmicutes)]MBT2673939.1 cupin domain-containing protein [Streptomyces sp. ISL-14]
MEKYLAYLQPNSSYHPEKHHHNTTELITVMSGTITINVNNESYTLNQYDSISSTNGTHSFANHTNDVVVLHIILKYGI